MTDYNGGLPSPADGQRILGADIAELASGLHAVYDSWTDFSASVGWTAATTAPAIGNGSITAKYWRLGKTVVYSGRILTGSSTTYGSGQWLVNLPVATYTGAPGNGSGLAIHTTVGSRFPIGVQFQATTQLQFYTPAGAFVSSTAPFTWANGDSLTWQITYEAA